MPPCPQSKQLTIQHVRDRSKWMPVSSMRMSEAQRMPVNVKPVFICGFSKTYCGSSKLIDGWRSVSPNTSHVIATRKTQIPRTVVRCEWECGDRIFFDLLHRDDIPCGC